MGKLQPTLSCPFATNHHQPGNTNWVGTSPHLLGICPSKSSLVISGIAKACLIFSYACLSAAGFTWPLAFSLLLLPDSVCCLESWLLKLPQCPSWGHCRLSMTKGALLQLWEWAEHCRVIWWPSKRPLPSSVPHYHWALMNSARSPWPSSHTQNITRSYGCARWVMVPSVSGLHSLNHSSLDLFQRRDGEQMPPIPSTLLFSPLWTQTVLLSPSLAVEQGRLLTYWICFHWVLAVCQAFCYVLGI